MDFNYIFGLLDYTYRGKYNFDQNVSGPQRSISAQRISGRYFNYVMDIELCIQIIIIYWSVKCCHANTYQHEECMKKILSRVNMNRNTVG